MIGGSYNGTTATATAVTDPPHLTTIVPEAAISRWYEYAYSGGIRYFWTNEPLGPEGPGSGADEGFDTPLAFDFGFVIPPPLDVTSADWADRVASTVAPCEELEHTLQGYDFDLPDYDAFWLERDYVVDAHRIDIPVLIAHNWGDWNVKQEEAVNLWRALVNAPKASLFMGTRWEGHGTPSGDYQAAVDAWFDHYLKGIDNGIERLAAVTSQGSDDSGPIGLYSGRWPRTGEVKLFAQRAAGDYQYRLLPRATRMPDAPAQFVSTGTNTESSANAAPRANSTWIHFETPELRRDARIFGEIKVQIYSTVHRRWVTYTPTVQDMTPQGDPLVSATRGWLDSRYRNTLAAPDDVTPDAPFEMTVVTKPQDYTFRAGHRIGLNIQTEIAEWSVPKFDTTCTDPLCSLVTIGLAEGRTRLVLSVVDPPRTGADLFR
jgi:X-Pro dipeptidyl-peptidase